LPANEIVIPTILMRTVLATCIPTTQGGGQA